MDTLPQSSAPLGPVREACDILIVGGGPAGSATAILLAQNGHRVVLVEKDRHPRFHIGESLLPANLPLFERLGVAGKMRAIGMEKWGAEFVAADDGRRQEFQFADAWNKSQPMAYQVRRSQFDEILIRRAAECGARVVEGCRVVDVDFAADGRVHVHALNEDGGARQWDAARLVDASGRDTFLGNRLRTKRRNKKHNSAALYAHFTGALRDCGRREGNISIYWFAHGWFWFIPLADGTTSVGAVVWPRYLKTRKGPLRDFFLATIAQCAPLALRLRTATMTSDVGAAGNYSYVCDGSCGANFLVVGDAYSFIDPVFSSGVMLAMQGGVAAAETLDVCLREPKLAAGALRRFERLMRHGPRQFSWFIYRMTSPTMRGLFLGPRNLLRMQEALLSLLAGDIFGNTPIWTSLRLFKGLYYLFSLGHPGRSLRAARERAAHTGAIDSESPHGG